MPDRVWECFECQTISRERLIRNLKEKQRQKVRERELKKERDRLEREFAKKTRDKFAMSVSNTTSSTYGSGPAGPASGYD